MSRVLVIGYGPLPQSGLRIYGGAGIRTRQIVKGIQAGKQDVRLFTLPLHGTSDRKGRELVSDEFEGLKFKRFENHSGEFAVETLNDEADRLKPDAIVGVGTYPSYVASMLASARPLWCDLGGSWMAEMQAKCREEEDDKHLVNAWNIERAILRRLDKFSAVSRPHLHATVGELGAVGRLNRYNHGYPFGSVVPHSVFRWSSVKGCAAPVPADTAGKILRGPIVPPSAFVILWSGGFKPASDVDTLIQAMDELMGRYDEVHFVSTGGATTSTETQTYRKFEQAVQDSPHKSRYHLMGWVESEKLDAIMRESDLGISVDFPCYETTFAGRHRLSVMAGSELAILTTVGTEATEWLDDAHAALTAPMRDSHALAQAVEAWIDQREKLRDYTRRATKMMDADFTDAETCAPLLRWLAHPENAPDNRERIKRAGESPYLATVALNEFEERMLLAESSEPPESHRRESTSRADEDGNQHGQDSALGRWFKSAAKKLGK